MKIHKVFCYFGKKRPACRSFAEYVKTNNDATWASVKEAETVNYPPPDYYGDSPPDFGSRIIKRFPQLGVFSLKNGVIISPNGWLFGNNKSIYFPDSTWYGDDPNNKNDFQGRIKVDRKAGTVVSLLSDWADNVYGHFLLDSLPRKHLFDLAEIDVNRADYILCPGKPVNRKIELLEKLGVNTDLCLWTSEFSAIRCEQALVTSFPGIRRNYSTWLTGYLRSALLPKNTLPPHRRLYVGRQGGTRDVSNLDEIKPILKKFAIEVFDPGKSTDPIRAFSESEFIVGPHGSGLSDIVFCPQNTPVLELLPSDHLHPYYYSLANASGLRYSCMVGKSLEQRAADAWGPSMVDFVINPDTLENALNAILS